MRRAHWGAWALFILPVVFLVSACGDSEDSGEAGGQGGSSSGATSSATSSAGGAGGQGSGASTGGHGQSSSVASATQSGSGGSGSDCAALTECGTCGQVEGCGWCGGTSTCMAGGEAGPTAGSCAEGWEPNPDLFSCDAAACYAAEDCGACKALGCGWCGDTGKCLPGTTTSAKDPSACGTDYWYFGSCPEDCASEVTCVSCGFGNKRCGWCKGTNGCMPGNDAGPTLGNACPSGWDASGDPFTCSD